MADVPGKFFSAKKVRTGVSPSSPGVIEGEVLPPVNPPGSSLAEYVTYTGATGNVDLGEYGIDAGFVNLDTTPTGTPTTQGTIYWDDAKSTAALIMNGTVQHIGQDTFFYVKNSSGSTIPKGTCVRFAGTEGASGHLLVVPFLANGSVPSTYFMGVTAEEITNGSFGQVMNFGELTGIDTSGFTAGALLYASSTVAGAFQTTAPTAPNNIVLVAAAVNSKNNGAIVVRPTYGSNINDDEGVKITSPTTGQLLQLQASGLWENKTKAQVLGGTSSQFVKGDGSLDSTTYQNTAEKGQPNGYASLDSNGKVPLVQINDALIGNVNFQGLWNASTNTPTLVDPPSSGTKGYYYIVSTGGTFAGITFEVGDWIISNGTAWGKVDNTDAVSSVFGRTGNVTASNGDYNTSQVTESGNLYYTDARSRAALSFVAGSGAYNSGTGVITIPTNNNQITNGAGYITSAALAGYVQGSGSIGSIPVFTAGSSIGNSIITATSSLISVTSNTDGQIIQIARNGGAYAWKLGIDATSFFNIYNNSNTSYLRINPDTGATTFTSSINANGITSNEKTLSRTGDSTWGQFAIANPNDSEVGITWGAGGTGYPGITSTYTRQWIAGLNPFATGTDRWSLTNKLLGANTAITVLENGKVGMGTISPNEKLVVVQNFNNTSSVGFYNTNSTGTSFGPIILAGTNSSDASLRVFNQAGTVSYLHVRGDGNVGIGVDNPQTRLHINGELTFTEVGFDTVRLNKIISAHSDGSSVNNNLQFLISDGTGNTAERFRINGAGEAILTGNITANSFIKSGGTSAQFLKADGSVDSTTYVPVGRTITINGTTQDLSANRTFNVGTVTSVTASSPLFSSGGTTPNITIQQASGSQNGFLSSTDWTTFNNKQNALTNPVTGTGTTNYLPKFTGSTTIGNSQVFDNGTNVFINGTSGNGKLVVKQTSTNLFEGINSYASTNDSFIGIGHTGSLAVINSTYNSTGVYAPLAFNTSDTERMRITSAGNVGIGVNNPQSQLHMNGSLSFTEPGFNTVRIHRIEHFHSDGNSANNNLRFLVSDGSGNTAERMRINGAGSFTVNNLSGSGNRIVVANSGGTLISAVIGSGLAFDGTTLTATGGGSGSISGSGTSGIIPVFTGSTSIGNSVITQSSGNIGISISSPQAKSHVANLSLDNSAYQHVEYLTANNSTEASGESYSGQASYGIGFRRQWTSSTFTNMAGIYAFGSGGWRGGLLFRTKNNTNSTGEPDVNALFLSPAGNVGIGTTSPNFPLQLTRSGDYWHFVIDGGTGQLRFGAEAGAGAVIQARTAGGTTRPLYLQRDGGNVLIGTTSDNGNRLRVNGTIFSDSSITATSFFESSDASLKTLVEDNYQAKGIDSVVAKLYIKNGKEELGYYAQDLQGVLPSAVRKGSNGLLNLSYREVHTAKIAYLEEEIRQLKKRYEIN